ncbi:kinase-like domain, phloem protein 2-like protein [Tanacetum coccineum]
MQIVDHKIKEETDEHVFSLSKGPNKESLAIFLEIAFRCVAETQAQRPTIEVVINELKKALDSQSRPQKASVKTISLDMEILGMYANQSYVMRLKICIDIAIGIEFLHGSVSSPGTIRYRDPLHSKTGFLTKESDIFSLGAVLFDVLCGKLSSEKLDDEYIYLPFLAKYHYHVGKLDKLVFEGIKEQIVPESYITFTRIALQCLHHMRERRPTANEVVIQLKKALEFQEDYYLLSFDGDKERNEMVSAEMFSYIASLSFEDEENFTEAAGIFRGRDVVGDGNPAGIHHSDELASIVMMKLTVGQQDTGLRPLRLYLVVDENEQFREDNFLKLQDTFTKQTQMGGSQSRNSKSIGRITKGGNASSGI